MNDKIFGELTFHFGWVKEEMINIWGNTYKIRIRTSSGKDDLPTEKQEKAYSFFKKNVDYISKESKGKVLEYINSQKESIEDALGIGDMEDPISLIRPFEVLFFQNGKFAILMKAKWDNVGMAVLCDGNTLKVGASYIVDGNL